MVFMVCEGGRSGGEDQRNARVPFTSYATKQNMGYTFQTVVLVAVFFVCFGYSLRIAIIIILSFCAAPPTTSRLCISVRSSRRGLSFVRFVWCHSMYEARIGGGCSPHCTIVKYKFLLLLPPGCDTSSRRVFFCSERP